MDQPTVLVVAVAVVGVLHTSVPDHWAPIALLARQRGWSWQQTARAAMLAGVGHTASTLAIAALVWIAGAALAVRFGHVVSVLSSVGLIAFGTWIAFASWREISQSNSAYGHGHFGHSHLHRHSGHPKHRHWHEHQDDDRHEVQDVPDADRLHEHAHETSSRTWLLVILGSSPMVEGIPAFFAASRYGPKLLLLMAVVFAASTILTYQVLCLVSASGLERMRLGRFERYGEMISGSFVALLGLVFLFFPSL